MKEADERATLACISGASGDSANPRKSRKNLTSADKSKVTSASINAKDIAGMSNLVGEANFSEYVRKKKERPNIAEIYKKKVAQLLEEEKNKAKVSTNSQQSSSDVKIK